MRDFMDAATGRYADSVCPECKGVGDWGGKCSTCNPGGDETKTSAIGEELVAMMVRVITSSPREPEDLARHIAQVLVVDYEITKRRKG